MSKNIHGTCGNCGGAVVTYMFYSGNQRPHCESCGAVAKNAFGQVIPMEKPPAKIVENPSPYLPITSAGEIKK